MKKLAMNSLSETGMYIYRPGEVSDRYTGTHEGNRAYNAPAFYLETPLMFSLV